MTDAYGKNWTLEGEQEGEAQMLVSNQQRAFAENFDVICCKHKAKEDRRSKARPYYPRKIKALIKVEQKYRRRVEKMRKMGKGIEELNIVRLVRAQKHLRKAKRE